MDSNEILLLTIVAAVVAGIFMQVFSEKLGIPAIVFLMIAGILLGPEFAGIINPYALGGGLEVVISLAVALLLFEGGLLLNFDSYKQVNDTVKKILSIGLIITVVGAAIAIHYVFGINWLLSLLYGSFMSNAGLTVINPILQRIKIKEDIGIILRAEGVLTKPIGTFLSIAILELILASNSSIIQLSGQLLIKFLVGIICGLLMGILLGKLMKKHYIGPDLKNLLVLAWVYATYILSNFFEKNTGILAVVVAGYAVQKESIPQLNTLKKFKGQLSILAISILFILVSAKLDLNLIVQSGFKGLLVVVLMMFVVRPIAVWVSAWGSSLTWKEILFISWIGPKGVVAASIATLSCLLLKKHGYEEADVIESVSYMTVFFTVLLQGLTVRAFARWTGCLVESDNVVIVGANVLGRTLGTAFKEIGRQVTLIDSNSDHCDIAFNEGLEAINGNCLDLSVLESAGANRANIMIATTSNSEINFLVCQIGKETFNIPEVYPAIDSPHKGVHYKLLDDIGGDMAYAKPVSITDWKEAVAKDKVKIIDTVLPGKKSARMNELILPGISEDSWIPLILKRKNGYFFVHADQEWSPGDVLIYLSK